jgi:hypothetical protein
MINFSCTLSCDLNQTLKMLKKKEAYGGSALDGDFEEAGTLALPFETGSWDATAFLASELKDASQVINLSKLNRRIHSCIKDELTLKGL